MRHLIMFVGLILIGNLALAQKPVDRDPSYSVNNYKHPNKAAYARKHNLDNSVQLQTASVTDNVDYKHPNKSVTTRKATLATRKEGKKVKTEKHPFGI